MVAANVPHHLAQRGNARQYVLERDEDRAVYLKLLRENIQTYNVALLGYCLMSNQVHLIAVPSLKDGLALACKNAHYRYAPCWNATRGARTVEHWRTYLTASAAESDLVAIRQCTHTGRPLGNAAFVSELEETTGRCLVPQRRGRMKDERVDPRQASLSLGPLPTSDPLLRGSFPSVTDTVTDTTQPVSPPPIWLPSGNAPTPAGRWARRTSFTPWKLRCSVV